MARHHIDNGILGPVAPFSDAVRLDGPQRWLVTSGLPGFDAEHKLSEDFATQAEWAWRNIIATVEKGGMSASDIVRVTSYLVRREDLPIYRAVCAKFLGNARPASMLMFVQGLPWPNMLLEITVEAARPVATS